MGESAENDSNFLERAFWYEKARSKQQIGAQFKTLIRHFRGLRWSDPRWQIGIDTIELTVPEPPTLRLTLACALIGFGYTRRRAPSFTTHR
jgi:hypothetical protein